MKAVFLTRGNENQISRGDGPIQGFAVCLANTHPRRAAYDEIDFVFGMRLLRVRCARFEHVNAWAQGGHAQEFEIRAAARESFTENFIDREEEWHAYVIPWAGFIGAACI